MYEDMELDHGVAYNSQNFDDEDLEFYMGGLECDGCFEDCPMEDYHKCSLWKECEQECRV